MVINKLKECLLQNNKILIKISKKDPLKDIPLEIIKEEIIIIIIIGNLITNIMMIKMIIKIIIIIEGGTMTFMMIEMIKDIILGKNIKITDKKMKTHLAIEVTIMKDL